MTAPEPPTVDIWIWSALILVALIGFYMFGIWLRHYVLPDRTNLTIKQQLAAGIPVALVTMGVYAKDAVPGLDLPQDYAISFGYAIVFGMLSKETLARMVGGTRPPTQE